MAKVLPPFSCSQCARRRKQNVTAHLEFSNYRRSYSGLAARRSPLPLSPFPFPRSPHLHRCTACARALTAHCRPFPALYIRCWSHVQCSRSQYEHTEIRVQVQVLLDLTPARTASQDSDSRSTRYSAVGRDPFSRADGLAARPLEPPLAPKPSSLAV